MISLDVSLVASVKRLSTVLFLILISGSFKPLRKLFRFSLKILGHVSRWKGYALLKHSRAIYLMFGSFTPVNFTRSNTEERIFSFDAYSPIRIVSFIASKRIEWSELFLLTCFVTSVFVYVLFIRESISSIVLRSLGTGIN